MPIVLATWEAEMGGVLAECFSLLLLVGHGREPHPVQSIGGVWVPLLLLVWET